MVALRSGFSDFFSCRFFLWAISLIVIPLVILIFFGILALFHPPFISIQKSIMVEGSGAEIARLINKWSIQELFVPSSWEPLFADKKIDISGKKTAGEIQVFNDEGIHKISITFSFKQLEWFVLRTLKKVDSAPEALKEDDQLRAAMVIGITPQTSKYSRLELIYFEEAESFYSRFMAKIYFESRLTSRFEERLYIFKERFESLRRRQ